MSCLNRKIILVELQEHVHEALKVWSQYRIQADDNPIGHLYLYRKRYFNGANPWQAMDHVLVRGLKDLEKQDFTQATLIRKRFLEKNSPEVVAEEFEIALSTFFVLQKEAIDALALIIYEMEKEEVAQRNVLVRERMDKLSHIHLIGIEKPIRDLMELLATPGPPWIITVEGLGGIGKTTLVQALIERLMQENVFYDFSWFPVRQRVFASEEETITMTKPIIKGVSIEEWLLDQLTIFTSTKLPVDTVTKIVTARVKKGPHLIIIDNLEALVDVESILPTLRRLVNPSKVILTCRQSAVGEPDVYRYVMSELCREHAYEFLRREAALRKHFALSEASDAKLERIYELVGGNPMALRLIVGQTQMYSFDLVLEDLKESRGEHVHELYTTIYRQAWDKLDEMSRVALLTMPLLIPQGGEFGLVKAATGLNDQDLAYALEKLVNLNLIDAKNSGLNKRLYAIHYLTRSFIKRYVVKWII